MFRFKWANKIALLCELYIFMFYVLDAGNVINKLWNSYRKN